jgi:predicted metalloendopeptidase
MGLIATLLVLAAQEAERGPAAREWENVAIAELLTDTARDYDAVWAGNVDLAAKDRRVAGTWTALDARNADLRRALIALHEAAESRHDDALQRRILSLYEAMAEARRLELPAG